MPEPASGLRPVYVFCDTPADHEFAEGLLRSAAPAALSVLKGVVYGLASERDLAALAERGLAVQVLNAGEAAPAASQALPAGALARRSKRSDPELQQKFEEFKAAAGPVNESSDTDWYRLTFNAPLTREARAVLRRIGVELTSYRSGKYQGLLTTAQVNEVRSLPFVATVDRYDLLDSTSSALLIEASAQVSPRPTLAAADPRAGTQLYEVIVHRGQDLAAIRSTLEATPGIEVLDASEVALRFRAPLDIGVLAKIAARREVESLGPFRPPRLLCDRAMALLGIDQVNAGRQSAASKPWSGEGEIVGVLDSGIDTAHLDFGGQPGTAGSVVTAAVQYNGCPVFDTIGHGTHVAGIVAGTGAQSAGKVRGIAPGAKLVVVGMVDANGDLQLPLDLSSLFSVATSRGASILNCSWERKCASTYDATARSLDQFVHEHPEVLVVVAAGNDGAAPQGEREFWKVGSPATAKNALTVGASGSDRPGFPTTWHDFRPNVFNGITGKAPLSPNPDDSAALSSPGPTDAESVKPDLLAPGTFVLAPRGSQISGFLGWVACSDYGGSAYVYMHGTSMAAPLVAGAAAILRQFLRVSLGVPNPSAALLKAILVNATRPLAEIGRSNVSAVGYPDFDHGFGRLDLSTVLPTPGAPANRAIAFDDVLNSSPDALESGLTTGDPGFVFHRYRLTVPPGATDPLRITLTWTDAPGRDVQNDLQLHVQLPDHTDHRGNETHTYRDSPLPGAPGLSGALDRRNTVHHLRITNPAAGDYTVRVWARNTVSPPQGYALAVCGQLQGKLVRT